MADVHVIGRAGGGVRNDAVSVIGVLPEDPDQIPVSAPEGFVWMMGGGVGSTSETFGIADVRVSIGPRRLDFAMTLADALALRDLLDQTISAMRECGDDESR